MLVKTRSSLTARILLSPFDDPSIDLRYDVSFMFGRPHQFLYAMVVEGRAVDTTIRFALCQVTVTVVNFTLD
jgi:hypothetical protein